MRGVAYSLLALSAVAGVTSCKDDATGPGPLATVEITADFDTMVVGDSIPFRAIPVDAAGKPIDGLTVTWATSNAAVASVAADGMTHGVAPGVAEISASTGGMTGTMEVTVTDVASPVGQ